MATDDPDGVLARQVGAAMDRVALSLLETRWRIEDYVKCEATWQATPSQQRDS